MLISTVVVHTVMELISFVLSCQVRAFVDGKLAAEGRAENAVPFHVHLARICKLPMDSAPLPVGFNLSLPRLQLGLHELHLFSSSDGQTWRLAFNMPAEFRESAEHPDSETALARKDAIILRRNAQLAMCWDERDKMGSYGVDRSSGGHNRSTLLATNYNGDGKQKRQRLIVAIAVNTVGWTLWHLAVDE